MNGRDFSPINLTPQSKFIKKKQQQQKLLHCSEPPDNFWQLAGHLSSQGPVLI